MIVQRIIFLILDDYINSYIILHKDCTEKFKQMASDCVINNTWMNFWFLISLIMKNNINGSYMS